MRPLTASVPLVVLLGLGATRATASDRTNWDELIVADGPRAAAERQALSQALRLLPRMPARVAVIDSEAAKPEVKATLLQLDAFIVKGSTVVYVVRQSALLRGAAKAQGFYTFALAAVLWHEMAHAEGHGESEARRREQELWTTFVRDQRIDQLTALRYLRALSRRPDVQVSAPHEPQPEWAIRSDSPADGVTSPSRGHCDERVSFRLNESVPCDGGPPSSSSREPR